MMIYGAHLSHEASMRGTVTSKELRTLAGAGEILV